MISLNRFGPSTPYRAHQQPAPQFGVRVNNTTPPPGDGDEDANYVYINTDYDPDETEFSDTVKMIADAREAEQSGDEDE